MSAFKRTIFTLKFDLLSFIPGIKAKREIDMLFSPFYEPG